MKEFNTTGICVPNKHYMVDITERLIDIKKMVDAGKYFTINRPRQYGKTTTLASLKRLLQDEYKVISLDFQSIGESGFQTEEKFVQEFSRLIWKSSKAGTDIPSEMLKIL